MQIIVITATFDLHSVGSPDGFGFGGPVSGVWSKSGPCVGVTKGTGVVMWLPGSACAWFSES